MMKTLRNILILVIMVFLFNCKEATKEVQTDKTVNQEVKEVESLQSSTEQSQAIIDHHLKAFLENNIEEFMKDYNESSVLVTQDTTLVGTESIKKLVSEFFTLFPKDSTNIEIDKLEVKDDMVYIIWHGDSPYLDVPFATDTFIISDNKIQRQTFAGILNAKE